MLGILDYFLKAMKSHWSIIIKKKYCPLPAVRGLGRPADHVLPWAGGGGPSPGQGLVLARAGIGPKQNSHPLGSLGALSSWI